MNNFYFPAHHEKLRDQNLEFNRLYAYPSVPSINDKKIILDSGAFHMHKARKKIDSAYVGALVKHYKKYQHLENVYCIAADTPKNFNKSLEITRLMLQSIPLLCPVLHNPKKHKIDLFSIKKQIKAYAALCSNRFIALSNNSLDIYRDFESIKHCVQLAKNEFRHVHIFGAGYTADEVKKWQETGADSVDSIGYYTDASSGVALDGDYSKARGFLELSLKNLLELNRLCKKN